MSSNENERFPLPVTIDQLALIKDAVEDLYYKMVTKATPKPLKDYEEDHYKGKSKKEVQRLAYVQETLQYIMLVYNIRMNTLNPDVAASKGLIIETDKATDSPGQQGVA